MHQKLSPMTVLVVFSLFFFIVGNAYLYLSNRHPFLTQTPKIPHEKYPKNQTLLAFDMNRDNLISTSTQALSKAHFDITGDGLREQTGWIKDVDAILVYDKNKDGKIGGIKEACGDGNISGFEFLKTSIDSNKDHKLNEKDPLFKELQLWYDHNQNGKADKDELQSLESAGIVTINLNEKEVFSKQDGHLMTKTSFYVDTKGNKGNISEIVLTYNPKNTSLDFAQLENFSIDTRTLGLPMIRGYGFVIDSFLAYQLNQHLALLAKQYTRNPVLIDTAFDEFINEWTGYNAYKTQIATKYHLPAEINMAELDRKIWIMEKFVAGKVLTDSIENNYETLAQTKIDDENRTTNSINGFNGMVLNAQYVDEKYALMQKRAQSIFALQSVFRKVLKGVTYKLDTDTIKVKDISMLEQSIITYFNDTTINLEHKIFLAKTIKILNETQALGANLSAIFNAINDTESKNHLERVMTLSPI